MDLASQDEEDGGDGENQDPQPGPGEPISSLGSPFAATFEVRQHNSNYGQLLSSFTLDGHQFSAAFSLPGLVGGTAAGQTAVNQAQQLAPMQFAATPSPTPSNNYNDMNYTSAQLNQLIKEKKQEITGLQHNKKVAQLELDKAKRTLENATVLATIDGQVRSLLDLETAQMENRPFLVVSGSQQYYISGLLSEDLLGKINVGDMVNVMSYWDGMSFTAQIVSISDYPAQTFNSNGYWGEGNPNSSSYEFTAMIMDPVENIQVGYPVDVTLNVNNAGDGETIYMDRAYFREDDAGYYVMMAGRDNRLKKQYIEIGGPSPWDTRRYALKSGFTLDDFLAFPYGPDVKEGVRVVLEETGEPPWPEDGALIDQNFLDQLQNGGYAAYSLGQEAAPGGETEAPGGETEAPGDETGGTAPGVQPRDGVPEGAVITGQDENGTYFQTENGGGIILD